MVIFTIEHVKVCAFNYYGDIPVLHFLFLACQLEKKDFGWDCSSFVPFLVEALFALRTGILAMTIKSNGANGMPIGTMIALASLCMWLVGVVAHLLFQWLFGTWYDGLVYCFGLTQAALMFVVTFGVAFIAGLAIESLFSRPSSLTRCIIFMANGLVTVPILLTICIQISHPGLTVLQLGTIVGLEMFFASVTWSVMLVAGSFLYEKIRRRS